MAQGSHATLSPEDARTCCVCGGKLRVTRDPALFFATALGLGWHRYGPDCEREGWRIYGRRLHGTSYANG